MTRRDALGLLMIALAGCGGSSEYVDEVDEYRQLRKMTNPTSEQLKRRDELARRIEIRKKAADRDAEEKKAAAKEKS